MGSLVALRKTFLAHRFPVQSRFSSCSEGVFKCPEDQLPLDYAKVSPDAGQGSGGRVGGGDFAPLGIF